MSDLLLSAVDEHASAIGTALGDAELFAGVDSLTLACDVQRKQKRDAPRAAEHVPLGHVRQALVGLLKSGRLRRRLASPAHMAKHTTAAALKAVVLSTLQARGSLRPRAACPPCRTRPRACPRARPHPRPRARARTRPRPHLSRLRLRAPPCTCLCRLSRTTARRGRCRLCCSSPPAARHWARRRRRRARRRHRAATRARQQPTLRLTLRPRTRPTRRPHPQPPTEPPTPRRDGATCGRA
jgi:hypothetical protein